MHKTELSLYNKAVRFSSGMNPHTFMLLHLYLWISEMLTWFIHVGMVCSYQTGNTVSNLIMILPPICGAIQTFRNGLERRYVCSFLGLAGGVDLSFNSLYID